MIKAFFMDLDGTLIMKNGEDRFIYDYDIAALKELVNHGVKVITASGRPQQYTIEMINAKYDFNFDVIAHNGAVIIIQGEETKYYFCDREKLIDLYVFLQDCKDVEGSSVSYRDIGYFERKNGEVGIRKTKSKATSSWQVSEVGCLQSLKDYQDGEPVKFIVFVDGIERVKNIVNTLIEAGFGENFEIFATDVHCLEIVAKGISKGSALKELCRYYGYSSNEIAAIGDSGNDVSMLELTKHSYAMEEALPEVKAVSTYQVASVAEAVAAILEYNKNLTE